MFRSEDDDRPSPPPANAFRPSVERLESRETPAVISTSDTFTAQSGRVFTQQNFLPLPGNLGGLFVNRGVLGNDYDDTLLPVPTFLVGLQARLVSGPINVATGQAITTPFAFNDHGPGSFTFLAPRNFTGKVSFTYQAYIAGGTSGAVTTATINVVDRVRRVAVGAGEGGAPRVDVFDAANKPLFSFYAYDQAFTGGVRVATGDFNADNVDDIVTVTGAGGAPNLRIFDGRNGDLLQSFYALDPNFTGGLTLATGDLNGDNVDDIVLGADRGGGPRVTVLNGRTFTAMADFYAYDPSFTGGVRVAVGDVGTNGPGVGRGSVIVSPGFGGSTNVRQYDFDGAGNLALTRSFFAGDPNDTRGLYVAAGDYNGDYFDDIVVGSGAGNAEVRVYNALDLSDLYNKNFGNLQQLPVEEGAAAPTLSAPQRSPTFGLTNGPGAAPISIVDTSIPPAAGTLQGGFSGGVRVSTTYTNGDDVADLLLASGPNVVPELTVFAGSRTAGGLFQFALADFLVFGGKFYNGIFASGHQ